MASSAWLRYRGTFAESRQPPGTRNRPWPVPQTSLASCAACDRWMANPSNGKRCGRPSAGRSPGNAVELCQSVGQDHRPLQGELWCLGEPFHPTLSRSRPCPHRRLQWAVVCGDELGTPGALLDQVVLCTHTENAALHRPVQHFDVRGPWSVSMRQMAPPFSGLVATTVMFNIFIVQFLDALSMHASTSRWRNRRVGFALFVLLVLIRYSHALGPCRFPPNYLLFLLLLLQPGLSRWFSVAAGGLDLCPRCARPSGDAA